MKARLQLAAWSVLATLSGLTSTAFATTDPPPLYDARGVGMGSTGVAHTHNAAAMFHNVAALHEVQTFTVTANFASLLEAEARKRPLA